MLEFNRLLSQEGLDPYTAINLVHRTIEEKELEFPEAWSLDACNIMAKKYFRQSRLNEEQETSVRQTFGRIVNALCDAGIKQKYFDDTQGQIFAAELTTVLLKQLAMFNSPVLFNVGIPGTERPLASACFINSVKDNMESILELTKTEGLIYKEGAGSGVNYSALRASTESIRGGGHASGPVSFMHISDAAASIILSGGRTRRAAKMCILNADHPDIELFIESKAKQEDIVQRLFEGGMSTDFNDPDGAYGIARYQNENHSVRVTDTFMNHVREVMHGYKDDYTWDLHNRADKSHSRTVSIKKLFHTMAEAAHKCGDPGIQFHDHINKMNTCANDGEISGSNPCFPGETLISTPEGFIPIRELCTIAHDSGTLTPVYTAGEVTSTPIAYMLTGINALLKIELSDGRILRTTKNHEWLIGTDKIPAKDLKEGMAVTLMREPSNYTGNDLLEVDSTSDSYRQKGDHRLPGVHFPEQLTPEFCELLGYLTGNNGFMSQKDSYTALGWIHGTSQDKNENTDHQELHTRHKQLLESYAPGLVGDTTNTDGCQVLRFSRRPIVEYFHQLGYQPVTAEYKRVPPCIFKATKESIAQYLRGYFGADGTVYGQASEGEAEVNCHSVSRMLLQDIQLLLQLLGIRSKLALSVPERDIQVREHEKVYRANAGYRLRIFPGDLKEFADRIGFSLPYKQVRLLDLLSHRKNVKAVWDSPTIVSIEEDGEEPTYNLTEPLNHLVYANGVLIPQCSEFMWLDDSACNLASINLEKFALPEHNYDVKTFKHVVRLLIIAQDIIVGIGHYPTNKIEENSHKYRPLGLGFANLGGLLMSWGIPYDSDEGRHLAAAAASLMTGQAYLTSAEVAAVKGTFERFDANRGPMEEVLQRHLASTRGLKKDLAGIHTKALSTWREAIGDGFGRKQEEGSGFRNCQVTLLAPTGTIAFVMDCATTGIEPDYALKKTKMLVGGEQIAITNPNIEKALVSLGYGEKDRVEIAAHVKDRGHLEGSLLKPEHLPVFDCSVPVQGQTRFLSVDAHIEMCAAIQPFLSGAISKTFNMPHNATVKDIELAFLKAWERGVKAVAVYRKGSKLSEPLRTEELKAQNKIQPAVKRESLPNDRRSHTHKFSVGGYAGYLTVGFYDDGRPGELFLRMAKPGSMVSGLLDSFATSISYLLQYGVPLSELVRKFEAVKFSPNGMTSNPQIMFATSIIDYLFKWMKHRFLTNEQQHEIEARREKKIIEAQITSPEIDEMDFDLSSDPCPNCGSPMVKTGSCSICKSCTFSTGVCS